MRYTLHDLILQSVFEINIESLSASNPEIVLLRCIYFLYIFYILDWSRGDLLSNYFVPKILYRTLTAGIITYTNTYMFLSFVFSFFFFSYIYYTQRVSQQSIRGGHRSSRMFYRRVCLFNSRRTLGVWDIFSVFPLSSLKTRISRLLLLLLLWYACARSRARSLGSKATATAADCQCWITSIANRGMYPIPGILSRVYLTLRSRTYQFGSPRTCARPLATP